MPRPESNAVPKSDPEYDSKALVFFTKKMQKIMDTVADSADMQALLDNLRLAHGVKQSQVDSLPVGEDLGGAGTSKGFLESEKKVLENAELVSLRLEVGCDPPLGLVLRLLSHPTPHPRLRPSPRKRIKPYSTYSKHRPR